MRSANCGVRVRPCPLKKSKLRKLNYRKRQNQDCYDSVNENQRFKDQTDGNVILAYNSVVFVILRAVGQFLLLLVCLLIAANLVSRIAKLHSVTLISVSFSLLHEKSAFLRIYI